RYVTEAEQAGARVLIDGRGVVVPGREGGFYVGPTVLDNVRPDMRIAQEEVFGPVLAILRGRDVDEAIAIENASPYGNAAGVHTQQGPAGAPDRPPGQRRDGWRERRRARAVGAVRLRRLERLPLRRRRHHREEFARVLDAGEEDHHALVGDGQRKGDRQPDVR